MSTHCDLFRSDCDGFNAFPVLRLFSVTSSILPSSLILTRTGFQAVNDTISYIHHCTEWCDKYIVFMLELYRISIELSSSSSSTSDYTPSSRCFIVALRHFVRYRLKHYFVPIVVSLYIILKTDDVFQYNRVTIIQSHSHSRMSEQYPISTNFRYLY